MNLHHLRTAAPRLALAAVLLLALAPRATAQNAMGIRRLESARVDGQDFEWGGIRPIVLRSDDSTQVGRGRFGTDDLWVTTRVVWNDEGLVFAILWLDDALDTAVLPRDSATWLDPNGRLWDRMYFYDNLAVRLRVGETLYSVWLSPSAEPNAYQHGFRRRVPPRRGEPIEQIAPKVRSHVREDGAVFIEMGIPWSELHTGPDSIALVNIHLIAPDSDWPRRGIAAKIPLAKYLTWQGDLSVLGRPSSR